MVNTKLEKHKVDFKKELETASKGMIMIHDPNMLIKMIIRMIVRKVKIKHAAMIMFDPESDAYVLSISKGETGIKGLYAAGDEYVGQISTAAIFGWLAAEHALDYIKENAPKSDFTRVKADVERNSDLIDKIRGRETGAVWKEVLIALQQIMLDYAGPLRSEPNLTAGLSHLRRMKDKARDDMMAMNQHELMRCLEVLNLFDVGESVFVTALERKETRGTHRRADYPFPNGLLDKMLVCRKVGDIAVAEWKNR